MGRAPTPGGLDDFIDIFKLRFPLELPFRFFLTCYQASRIAGAPRAFDYWNRMAGNFAARIQHFSDRCSAACSQVERIASLRRERQKMRRSDVSDMNVISDTGPVRRLEVGAKNLRMVRLAKGDPQNAGNQMRFCLVVFAILF